MTVGEIAALLRRHWIAAGVVLVLAAAALYTIKSTVPSYQETSTVTFVAPKFKFVPNPYDSYSDYPLNVTNQIVAKAMMSPQSQRLVQAAGGTGDYTVAPVNLYNQQYPDYGVPETTITTTASSPEAAHSTYVIVARLLANRLARMQAKVKPGSRIVVNIAGDSGPIIQVGSNKRAYGGLLVLALVGFFMLAIFLDRHPGLAWRPGGARRAPTMARRPQASGPS